MIIKYILILFVSSLILFLNCIRNMNEQPSIRPFESPIQQFPEKSMSKTESPEIKKDINPINLKNPFQKTDESVRQGRIYYEYYCRHCHGENADGESPVGQSLSIHPKNLTDKNIQSKSDGELFYIITYGKNGMPSLKETVEQERRWLIINYLRTFEKKE